MWMCTESRILPSNGRERRAVSAPQLSTPQFRTNPLSRHATTPLPPWHRIRQVPFPWPFSLLHIQRDTRFENLFLSCAFTSAPAFSLNRAVKTLKNSVRIERKKKNYFIYENWKNRYEMKSYIQQMIYFKLYKQFALRHIAEEFKLNMKIFVIGLLNRFKMMLKVLRYFVLAWNIFFYTHIYI